VTSAPTYQSVASDLAELCRRLSPGDRLPSEHEVAEANNVSRITARSALQELEQRHLIRRTRGAGSFVALRLPYPVRSGMPPSWSAIVRSAGHEPSHSIIGSETVRARAEVAKALLMPRGRSVVHFQRLGFVDGEVAAHQTSYVPAVLAPDLVERVGEGSLTETFVEHYGFNPDRWWSRAELAVTPASIAGQLELSGPAMAWRIESVNVCAERGSPIELTVGWLRADSFRVFLESGPTDGLTQIADIEIDEGNRS
jgi:DNA-binding GntR family transcriptional regulator